MSAVITKKGAALAVGDVLVWSETRRDRITSLRPYTGTLGHIFPEGAQIAVFAVCPGMTIDNSDFYEVVP